MESLAGYPPQLRQDGERGMPNDLAAAALALELRHCGFPDRCLGNLYIYSYCSMQQLFVV
jgi:hypothetical protein